MDGNCATCEETGEKTGVETCAKTDGSDCRSGVDMQRDLKRDLQRELERERDRIRYSFYTFLCSNRFALDDSAAEIRRRSEWINNELIILDVKYKTVWKHLMSLEAGDTDAKTDGKTDGNTDANTAGDVCLDVDRTVDCGSGSKWFQLSVKETRSHEYVRYAMHNELFKWRDILATVKDHPYMLEGSLENFLRIMIKSTNRHVSDIVGGAIKSFDGMREDCRVIRDICADCDKILEGCMPSA